MRLGNWFTFVAALGIGSVAALASQGCTVTTGASDLDGGFDFDAEPQHDAGVVSTVCTTCLGNGCSAYYSACLANPQCPALSTCLAACPDEACRSQCSADHASGYNTYNAWYACGLALACSSCASECPGRATAEQCAAPPPDAGADVAAPTPTTDAAAPSACNQCVLSSCSSEKQACGKGSDCDAYTQCVFACADSPCIDKCGTDHASGKTDGTALGTCTSNKCAAACGLQ